LKNKSLIIATFLVGLFITIIIIIPKHKSKKKFNPGKGVTTNLKYTFKTEKAEHLSVMAFESKKLKKFDEAIELYRQAIKIEPNNPRLFFDLSECYTNTNKPERAILILDTAIMLDKTCAAFYNNRGLIYWKLYRDQNAINDYKKAIELDSTNWVFYGNISRVYYANNKLIDACINLQIAKRLGLDLRNVTDDEEIQKIAKVCKQ